MKRWESPRKDTSPGDEWRCLLLVVVSGMVEYRELAIGFSSRIFPFEVAVLIVDAHGKVCESEFVINMAISLSMLSYALLCSPMLSYALLSMLSYPRDA
jgi:hypothetical protein